MLVVAVDQAIINFVGDDDQIVLLGNARNFQHARAIHHCAGGIAREANE